jgi:hypothetical protein
MKDSPSTDFSRSRSLLIAMAAIFLLPAVAAASPSFGGFVTTVSTVQNSPTPVILSGSEDLAGRHGEGATRAANTLGGRVLASAAAHGLSGSFETFSFDATGVYDDLVITGPVAGASVPFTLHLPIRVDFFQDYSSITFASGVDASQPSNAADFQATLFTPTGGVQGRLDLHSLIDAIDTADILLTGQVVPTGDPGPTSTETLETGITIFHNFPLGTGGFLNLFSRTQIPITSTGGPLGAGAGLADQDIVELRAEILLSGTATVGTPLTLSLVPQDGSPVFDLPPGFSADSAELGVADNVVVPEPGAPAVGATALVALGCCRRQHRRETR